MIITYRTLHTAQRPHVETQNRFNHGQAGTAHGPHAETTQASSRPHYVRMEVATHDLRALTWALDPHLVQTCFLAVVVLPSAKHAYCVNIFRV